MRNIRISYVLTDAAADSAEFAFVARLQPEERERASRFVHARDRLAFALGRVLARRLLSERAPAPPGGWRFFSNAYGRPEVASADGAQPPRFNISHCAGMVVAACTVGQDVGVDVERVDRDCDELELARHSFAPAEIRAVKTAAAGRRRAVFFAIWTLKEAYIKARGMGLSIPLSQFSVTPEPPGIDFHGIDDDPRRWQLWRRRVAGGFELSVAAARAPGEELGLVIDEPTVDALL